MIKNIATITLLFSFAIYSEYFGITSFLFNTIVGILAIYYLFLLDKKTLSYSGFFIGIAWFHWISISFVYYGFWYLIPIGIIGIGFVYGLLFYILGFFKNIFYRLFTIYAISFMDPFGFNWFKIDLLFVNSYIHSSHILIILVFLFLFLKNHQKVIPFFLLPFILYTPKNHIELKNNNIKLVTTNIPQDQKWKQHSVKISFFRIKPILEKAIKNNKKIIIFPESSIEGYLNQQPHIIQYLKEKSHNISIVIGSLTIKNNKLYNSNYIFEHGQMKIAHKVVLVPIGEKVPLPQFLTDIINDIFYDGAIDYSVAKQVTDYKIQNQTVRNAICFEATTDIIYEDNPKYVIANSNNAWFTPSIQPILQKMLLQYYSNEYKTTIYHSINGYKSYIIKPY